MRRARVFLLAAVLMLATTACQGRALTITGSIVQPPTALGYDAGELEALAQTMAGLGQDHLIVQWTVDADAAYYGSAPRDLLADILAAADAAGIEVWVGLNWSEEWWQRATDPAWLRAHSAAAVALIDDICDAPAAYTTHPSFAGWYLPWEVDNVTFTAPDAQVRLRDAMSAVVARAKQRTAKPVMISPFVTDDAGQSPQQWGDMWLTLLDVEPAERVDVLALQDGIGVAHTTFGTLPDWYRQTAAAARARGVQTWANVETFRQVGADRFEPADDARIAEQLRVAAPYASAATSFSFVEFQYPARAGE